MIGWGPTYEAQKIQKINNALLRNKNGFQKQKDSLGRTDIGKDWKFKEATEEDLKDVRVKLAAQKKAQRVKSLIILSIISGIISIWLISMLAG